MSDSATSWLVFGGSSVLGLLLTFAIVRLAVQTGLASRAETAAAVAEIDKDPPDYVLRAGRGGSIWSSGHWTLHDREGAELCTVRSNSWRSYEVCDGFARSFRLTIPRKLFGPIRCASDEDLSLTGENGGEIARISLPRVASLSEPENYQLLDVATGLGTHLRDAQRAGSVDQDATGGWWKVRKQFRDIAKSDLVLETSTGEVLLSIRLRGGRIYLIDSLSAARLDMRGIAVLLVAFINNPSRWQSSD